MSDDNAPLFDMFAPASPEDWRREAARSLKGARPEKLARRQPEGFALDPIYFPGGDPPHAEADAPGHSPFVRGRAAAPGWGICPAPLAPDAATWNRLAHGEIAGGADGLVLRLEGTLLSEDDLPRALEGLDLAGIELVIEAGSAAPAAADALAEAAGGLGGLRGALSFDPLATLVSTGRASASLFDEMTSLVLLCEEHAAGARGPASAPGLTALTCHGEPYHGGGANAVQELAFTIAAGAQYLRALVERGVDPDAAARRIDLSFEVGSRLLVEVAKLRAARLLWDTVCAAFGCAERSRGARIHVYTSAWSQSVRDPWVNLLRGTVQTFAAVVGGARRVTVRPFDEAIGMPGGLSRRIARNTMVILRDESFLDRVVDPVGGAWALEALTDRVGREAWALVQEIERRGGMLAAVEEGFPQGEVRRAADARRAAVARREETFVGVSVFPNLEERPREVAPLPAVRPLAPTGALIEADPIPRWRGVEAIEALRERADASRPQTGGPPRATLACWGDRAALRPRLEWVRGAMAAGGFVLEGDEVFRDAGAAAEACRGSGERVVVACAADADYPAGVEALRAALGQAAAIVVAGAPPEEGDWADNVFFLHRGADLVAALEGLPLSPGVSR